MNLMKLRIIRTDPMLKCIERLRDQGPWIIAVEDKKTGRVIGWFPTTPWEFSKTISKVRRAIMIGERKRGKEPEDFRIYVIKFFEYDMKTGATVPL